jgi:hypothetical protein
MTRRVVTTSAALAEELMIREMPDLDEAERAAAVHLVATAVAGLPDSLRPGVALAGMAIRVRRSWAGASWTEVHLPFVREYVRLVRGLALAAASEVSSRRAASP